MLGNLCGYKKREEDYRFETIFQTGLMISIQKRMEIIWMKIMKKIGFIGMGNMAQAIAAGMIQNNLWSKEQMYAYAPNQDKLEKNAKSIGFIPVDSLKKLVETVDTLIMACKPYQIEGVLNEVKDEMKGKSILSIALGWSFEKYQSYVDASTRVQFIMPNTPAKVSEGVFLFEQTNSLEADDRALVMDIFSKLGKVAELPSNLMGIGGAITGCGPAFVDLFLEGFADAAVKYGIPRTLAYELVSQTVLGSAKLQLETGEHPGILKDAVCSPGGSTIRGVDALEHAGLRAACIDAIDAVMGM